HQAKGVEILVDHRAVLDADGLMQRRTEPIQNRPLRLVIGSRWIDDLPADVHRRPYLVDFRHAALVDARLDHLGNIAEMAVAERQPHPDTLWQGLLAPA